MPKIDESRPFLPVNIAVLTISDTRTSADDRSGDALQSMIESDGHKVVLREILRLRHERAEARDFFPDVGRHFPELAAKLQREIDPVPLSTGWNIFALPDIGLLGYSLTWMGIDYDYTQQPLSAWFTVILMDVWHWTSLVVLLAYAGLVSIPDAYYQAAKIDGARPWAVFRYIQLPKMNRVLTIAILLRFMDSFMIYTEPFVLTGGGPGNSTTFLSIDLVKIALGQFDLGPAAAMSLIYFVITLLVSWVFYTVMTRGEQN